MTNPQPQQESLQVPELTEKQELEKMLSIMRGMLPEVAEQLATQIEKVVSQELVLQRRELAKKIKKIKPLKDVRQLAVEQGSWTPKDDLVSKQEVLSLLQKE